MNLGRITRLVDWPNGVDGMGSTAVEENRTLRECPEHEVRWYGTARQCWICHPEQETP